MIVWDTLCSVQGQIAKGIEWLPRQGVTGATPLSLIFKRRSLAGSPIGGIRETQEMPDYCIDLASLKSGAP